MGIVNKVSRVLFSFSKPMELMTILSTIMMMIMITSGIINVCSVISLEMSAGVMPECASSLTIVLMMSS